jgi:hypothetical protein
MAWAVKANLPAKPLSAYSSVMRYVDVLVPPVRYAVFQAKLAAVALACVCGCPVARWESVA